MECQPNECNTHTSDNPNGNGKFCTEMCNDQDAFADPIPMK